MAWTGYRGSLDRGTTRLPDATDSVSVRRIFRLLLAPLAIATALGVGVANSPGAPRAGSETAQDASLAIAIVHAANAVRAAEGVPTLAVSPALTRASVAHSLAMARDGFFSHSSQDGTPFSQRIVRFYPRSGSWTVGENLAAFGGVEPTATQVVDAWLGSPPHRANLLRRTFREAGVAVVRSSSGPGRFSGMQTWVVTLDLGARGSGG